MKYDNNKLNMRADAHYNGVQNGDKLKGAYVMGVREAFEDPQLFKPDGAPPNIRKTIDADLTGRYIDVRIEEFLLKLPASLRDEVRNKALYYFPIHLMHTGNKKIEFKTRVQRMNFIQGVVAAYEHKLLIVQNEIF